MKRCLITIAFLSCILNSAFGQSASAIIDKLIKEGVITSKERPALESELKKHPNVSYRTAILSALEYLSLKKTFHIDPHKTGIFYSYRNDSANRNNKQDSINCSLSALLNKINRTGLLKKRVYNRTLQNIDSSKMIVEVQLYSQLAGMTYRLEWLAPDKLLPVAEQLHQGRVLSDSSLNRLKHDIKSYQIESIEQLTSYCEQVHQFDLSRYKGEAAVLMEQVIRDITTILPDVHVSNFNYTATPDTSSPKGLDEINTKISFTCNGRTYRHRGHDMILKNRKGEVIPDKLHVLEMLGVFNTILADSRSPLRLHTIMAEPSGSDDHLLDRFAVAVLNADQAKILLNAPCSSYLMFSFADYGDKVNSALVDSVIDQFTKVGLFAHLSTEQLKKSAEDVEVEDLYNMDNLLANFPGVIYQTNSLMMDTANVYINMLKNLGQISHGAFSPKAITQKLTKNNVTITYTSNGEHHTHTLVLENSWPKTGLSPLLKQLAAENHLSGNFYNIAFGSAIVYLTPPQYKYVAAHKLLEFSPKM